MKWSLKDIESGIIYYFDTWERMQEWIRLKIEETKLKEKQNGNSIQTN